MKLGLNAELGVRSSLPGKRLEPIGVKIGQWLVDGNLLDKFAKPLAQWQTGHGLITLAAKLWRPVHRAQALRPYLGVSSFSEISFIRS